MKPVPCKTIDEALSALSKGKTVKCGKGLQKRIPMKLKPLGLYVRSGGADHDELTLVGDVRKLKKHLKDNKVDHMSSNEAMDFLKKSFLKTDLKMDKSSGGGYIPSKSVLGNRERQRQRDLVDALGKEMWGDQYASEFDTDRAMWATYRDNKDKDVWEAQMMAFAHLLKKKLGLRMKDRAVFFDSKKIKEAIGSHEDYLKMLAEKGSRGAQKALGIEASVSGSLESLVSAARKQTFKVARANLFDHLRKNGWMVKDTLKVPWAEEPDGDLRLWFKPQAVWVGGRALNTARSTWMDIREYTPEQFLSELRKTLKQMGFTEGRDFNF